MRPSVVASLISIILLGACSHERPAGWTGPLAALADSVVGGTPRGSCRHAPREPEMVVPVGALRYAQPPYTTCELWKGDTAVILIYGAAGRVVLLGRNWRPAEPVAA